MEEQIESATAESQSTPQSPAAPKKVPAAAPSRKATPTPIRPTPPATPSTAKKTKAAEAPQALIPTHEVVETKIDQLGKLLEQTPSHQLTLDELGKQVGADPKSVERIGRVLQEHGVAELIYPVSVFARPLLHLLTPQTTPPAVPFQAETLLETYELSADGVPAWVQISRVTHENRPIYDIRIARPGAYTRLYLEQLREQLAREVPILTEEITDPKKLLRLKQRFFEAAQQTIQKDMPELEERDREILSGMLLHKLYGLGVLELLMVDEKLEEIAVNSAGSPISVYHKRIGWLKSTVQIDTEEEIYNYASTIGRKAGREITLLNPILDAPLLTGDRATATLFPISGQGNTITIRRFAREPWTLVSFLDPAIKSISIDMAAFLWQAVQYEQNIIFSGGTASGKTSALNATTMFIPPSNRIVTVEEVRELALPTYLRWNWVPFVTRGQNPEGKGEVSMLDLMVASLRMRPDRIIVGEVRRAREAEVLFEAMHTGHAVYSTLHADNAQQAVRRLLNPPISVAPTELETLQLFVVQYRDRRTGIRRMSEITEVVPGIAGEVNLNPIYRWRARTDTFDKVGESVRVLNELSTHTGMTLDEIHQDRADKAIILEWMYRQNLKISEQVGAVMNVYYRDPEAVLQAASKNQTLERLVGE